MTSSPNERRREPRIPLRVRVNVEGRTAAGVAFSVETRTYDVSPSGVSVELTEVLQIGALLYISSPKFPFRAQAVVRNRRTMPGASSMVVGVEFLDGKQFPVVDWHLDDSHH